jgi:hypothetical protein
MLGFLEGRAGERKLRLFAAACCRCLWDLLTDGCSHRAVEVAERYADGAATGEDMASARAAATITAASAADTAAWAAADTANGAAWAAWVAASAATWDAALVALLRDIFGNPFRPMAVDPNWLAWRGGTVPRLAQAPYEERQLPAGLLDNLRLSVLADALEEAGCSDADILGHLRAPGPMSEAAGPWIGSSGGSEP